MRLKENGVLWNRVPLLRSQVINYSKITEAVVFQLEKLEVLWKLF